MTHVGFSIPGHAAVTLRRPLVRVSTRSRDNAKAESMRLLSTLSNPWLDQVMVRSKPVID